jgi:hypothetical protein
MIAAGTFSFIFTIFAIDYDVIIKQEGGECAKFN